MLASSGLQARTAAVLGCLRTSGSLAFGLVAVGGASFGLAAWQALLGPYLPPAGAIVGASACVLLGALAIVWTWYATCTVSARNNALPLESVLRWDAWSYGSLVAYPVLVLAVRAPYGPHLAAVVALAAFVIAKAAGVARHDAGVRTTLASFVVTRAFVFAASAVGALRFARHTHAPVLSTYPLLGLWGNWDAVHYLDIARRGYAGSDMAFFPLYPTLIRELGNFLGDDLIAAIAISNVAFFIGLTMLRLIVEEQFGASAAARAVLYAAIFPTSFFFSAAYSESLFFALSLGTAYAIRRGHWLTAGIAGGLAALTRVEGLLLFVLYGFEIVAPDTGLVHVLRVSRYVRRYLAIGASLIPLGLLAYMFLLLVLCGDPLYFLHVQSHWNRHLAFPWASIERSISLVLTSHSGPTIAVQSVELSFTILVIAVLVLGYRELRPSYLAYAVASILVPLSTSSLMSIPRFALEVFPMFLILSVWGERPWVHRTIVAVFVPLLALFSAMFAAYYWVA